MKLSAADRILLAIENLDQPYGNTILDEVNRAAGPGWLVRLFPALEFLSGMSVGGMYVHLMRLERDRFIHSWWGERTAERGWRRRRYYGLTATGWKRVWALRSTSLVPGNEGAEIVDS